MEPIQSHMGLVRALSGYAVLHQICAVLPVCDLDAVPCHSLHLHCESFPPRLSRVLERVMCLHISEGNCCLLQYHWRLDACRHSIVATVGGWTASLQMQADTFLYFSTWVPDLIAPAICSVVIDTSLGWVLCLQAHHGKCMMHSLRNESSRSKQQDFCSIEEQEEGEVRSRKSKEMKQQQELNEEGQRLLGKAHLNHKTRWHASYGALGRPEAC